MDPVARDEALASQASAQLGAIAVIIVSSALGDRRQSVRQPRGVEREVELAEKEGTRDGVQNRRNA